MASQIKGGKELKKKQTTKHYQSWFMNTQKILCMLLLEFQDDLKNFR